jgi:hypothetical protein
MANPVLVFQTLSFGLYLQNRYFLLEERVASFQEQAAKKTYCLPFDMALQSW